MATQFPIPDFVGIPAQAITEAVNDFIGDINAVVVQNGGGAGAEGFVTRRQLFQAMSDQSIMASVDAAVNALLVTDPAWGEYKTALTCAMNGPLAGVIASTTGYTADQMLALWALAETKTP